MTLSISWINLASVRRLFRTCIYIGKAGQENVQTIPCDSINIIFSGKNKFAPMSGATIPCLATNVTDATLFLFVMPGTPRSGKQPGNSQQRKMDSFEKWLSFLSLFYNAVFVIMSRIRKTSLLILLIEEHIVHIYTHKSYT